MKKILKFIGFLLLIFIVIPLIGGIIMKIFGKDLTNVIALLKSGYVVMTIVKIIIFAIVSFFVLPGYFKRRLDEIKDRGFSTIEEEIAFNKKRDLILNFLNKKYPVFIGFIVLDIIITHIPYYLIAGNINIGG